MVVFTCCEPGASVSMCKLPSGEMLVGCSPVVLAQLGLARRGLTTHFLQQVASARHLAHAGSLRLRCAGVGLNSVSVKCCAAVWSRPHVQA
jgi:hypothetical protein